MINTLIVIDIILAIIIIGGVFLHQSNDGFIGEATSTTNSGPKFEPFDKIISVIVLAFFGITLTINYLTFYKHKGTADIDAIIESNIEKEKAQKIEKQTSDFKTEAPVAE